MEEGGVPHENSMVANRALLFALITAVFAVINVKPVAVNLLFGTVNVPLILLIIGCSLIGDSLSARSAFTVNIKCRRRSVR